MSKGTTVYSLRVPDPIIAQVEEAIHRRNHHSYEQPLDRSAFIVAAIREKLQKMARSRTSQPRPRSEQQ